MIAGARSEERRWARTFAPPVLAFIASELVVGLAASRAGFAALEPATWQRWDSEHYLAIAAHGYGCEADGCGPLGWFPGYPSVIHAVTGFGLSLPLAGLLVARAAALGMLLVVWVGLLDRRPTLSSYAALTFAAFVPGMVYFHAIFPMSLAALGLCTSVLCIREHRWWGAGAVLALTATTYPAIAAIGASMAAWALVSSGGTLRARIGRAAILAGATALGDLAVVYAIHAGSGRWDGYFAAQSQHPYRRGFAPYEWYRRVDDFWQPGGSHTTALQVFVVFVILVALTVNELRSRGTPVSRLVLWMGWATWLFPLTIAQSSIWRVDSLLVPLVVAVARLPRAVAIGVAVATIPLAALMATLYVRNELV